MPNSQTVDVTIRNHRYQGWPAQLLFVAVGLVSLTIGLLLLKWLPSDLAIPVMIGTILLFGVSMTLALRRIPNSVARIKVGLLLSVFPGGRAHPPSTITEIAYESDPAEDYAESHLPVRMCQARINFRQGGQIRLIISSGDAARLREWATKYGIAVNDPEGYSSWAGRTSSATGLAGTSTKVDSTNDRRSQ